MPNTIFATKIGMSQAWSKLGKRLPITKLSVADNRVLTLKKSQDDKMTAEIAYGAKKLKNMAKPLRKQFEKSGFSFGASQIRGIKVTEGEVEVGKNLNIDQVLAVGDVVSIQGVSKGRGFAGGVKRHGFHGGPRTHGQSDRQRAVGSIGSGTDPGRVWKGKKMPGHYGVDTKTVSGLVVAYIDHDKNEIWVTGPVPGFNSSTVRIEKTGAKREIELNLAASGIEVKEATPVKEEASAQTETTTETQVTGKKEASNEVETK